MINFYIRFEVLMEKKQLKVVKDLIYQIDIGN